MGKGAFEIISCAEDPADYNIQPLCEDGEVPQDQAALQSRIYATRGVLKLLREAGLFGTTKGGQPVAIEFTERVRQIAQVGLTGACAQTGLATGALEQVRAELLARKGKQVIYKYLTRLGGFALVGVALGAAFHALGRVAPVVGGYGLVVGGAMIGAWLSAAANRRDITFNDLPDFLGSVREPIVRIVFVAVLAVVVALFIQEGVFSITLGDKPFQAFASNGWTALLLGVISGIGERALSVKVLQRAGEFTTN